MNQDNFAIIMAGGVGARFWPVSTRKHPKQFRDLLGSGESLIQTTFNRLWKLLPSENILVLTNTAYKDLLKEQLPQLEPEQIVLEPAMRNTAPAVLLAALKIFKRNPNAVMLMAPSDHWIQDEAAFKTDMTLAFENCRKKEQIISLGVKPSFPNTGFGYIKFENTPNRIKKIEKFTEKPDFETAMRFISNGNYLWNAGIFIWNTAFILDSFKRNLPEMYHLFSEGDRLWNTAEEKAFIAENYPKAENISIDYGILEKETESYVIPVSFDWNDLGTWGAVYDEIEKDENENVVLNAQLLTRNASGNILSSDANRVVVLEDLQDFIIIDEKEVLLIVPKHREQDIKTIRASVQKKFGKDLG